MSNGPGAPCRRGSADHEARFLNLPLYGGVEGTYGRGVVGGSIGGVPGDVCATRRVDSNVASLVGAAATEEGGSRSGAVPVGLNLVANASSPPLWPVSKAPTVVGKALAPGRGRGGSSGDVGVAGRVEVDADPSSAPSPPTIGRGEHQQLLLVHEGLGVAGVDSVEGPSRGGKSISGPGCQIQFGLVVPATYALPAGSIAMPSPISSLPLPRNVE